MKRRLAFQLTPLLDLLLIVIFAQFMEVNQASQQNQEVFRRKEQDLERQLWELDQRTAAVSRDRERSLALLSQILKRSAADLNDSELARLATQGVASTARHLEVFTELRKRADLWNLHLQDDGVCLLEIGETVTRFKATSAEIVAAELVKVATEIDQPRGLVVILCSHGNARFKDRLAVEDGVPIAATRIREIYGPTIRVEFGLLGYRVNW